MDLRLYTAARLGDVVTLGVLLEEDPLILEKVALSTVSETPLHVATLAGKTNFVKQIISLKPSFAWELNQDGFSPLHIASATGNVEIVRELLKLGKDLCFLEDKGGRTPLHYAAIKGRVYVIQELLAVCPDAIKEVTANFETALHLAVKNNQFEALKFLVERPDNISEVIDAKDREGNTMSQLAVATRQLQVLEFLRSQSKLGKEIMEVVSGEQFEGVTDIVPQATQTDKEHLQQTTDQSTQDNSDSIWSEVEEMVLVVASLIATVTYQAGLSPPQTIWKEDMKLDSKCIFHGSKSTSFLSSKNSCPPVAYYLFLSFNTAGFFASVFLIFFFRNKTYVKVLLPIALISMMITYITLSVTMTESGLSFLFIYLITLAIFIYCVLAVKVVQTIVNSIFGFAVGKVTGIARSVMQRPNPSQADASKADP